MAFQTPGDYQEYLDELESKACKRAARSPAATRQDRCHKRRRAARNYWRTYLRGGQRAESWIEGISPAIVEAAKTDIIKELPELAKRRGLA